MNICTNAQYDEDVIIENLKVKMRTYSTRLFAKNLSYLTVVAWWWIFMFNPFFPDCKTTFSQIFYIFLCYF